MNLQRILCVSALAIAALFVFGLDTCEAQGINPWGRPTYSGYPAYGYQYHDVHHHHYVYRPNYHQWHPAGWGNHGPYGGWYGGGFIWAGPGNCEACYQNTGYYSPHDASPAPIATPDGGIEDLPADPIQDLVPELPALP